MFRFICSGFLLFSGSLAWGESSVLGGYAIVDTGQEKCYNNASVISCKGRSLAFTGQDAQYTRNAPNYSLGASGKTVIDKVTGLTWQSSPDTNGDGLLSIADKMTFAAAGQYCSSLNAVNYEGLNDWRLPTIKELYSLINFNGKDPDLVSKNTKNLQPFIDRNYFQFAYGFTSSGERIIDTQYVSSNVYVDKIPEYGQSQVFGVNFADGRIKGYGLKSLEGVEKLFAVQCVSGGNYGLNKFIDNGNQTITDEATGLMWTQQDSGTGMDWKKALAWVNTQNQAGYLGHSDWRLPNAKELQSIVDYSRSPGITQSAAIDPIFDSTAITNEDGQQDWPWYWTSTTHQSVRGKGRSAVYLAFGRATGWFKLPGATCYSLFDVHGAGSQRSDPKTRAGVKKIGRACNGAIAYGFGPQGDVLRSNNYIRLVRTTQ